MRPCYIELPKDKEDNNAVCDSLVSYCKSKEISTDSRMMGLYLRGWSFFIFNGRNYYFEDYVNVDLPSSTFSEFTSEEQKEFQEDYNWGDTVWYHQRACKAIFLKFTDDNKVCHIRERNGSSSTVLPESIEPYTGQDKKEPLYHVGQELRYKADHRQTMVVEKVSEKSITYYSRLAMDIYTLSMDDFNKALEPVPKEKKTIEDWGKEQRAVKAKIKKRAFANIGTENAIKESQLLNDSNRLPDVGYKIDLTELVGNLSYDEVLTKILIKLDRNEKFQHFKDKPYVFLYPNKDKGRITHSTVTSDYTKSLNIEISWREYLGIDKKKYVGTNPKMLIGDSEVKIPTGHIEVYSKESQSEHEQKELAALPKKVEKELPVFPANALVSYDNFGYKAKLV